MESLQTLQERNGFQYLRLNLVESHDHGDMSLAGQVSVRIFIISEVLLFALLFKKLSCFKLVDFFLINDIAQACSVWKYLFTKESQMPFK